MARFRKQKAKTPAISARRRTAAYQEYKHPERGPLIRELLENLHIAQTPLYAETHAFLWLSNIHSLRSLVRKSRRLREGERQMIRGDGSDNDDDDDDEDDEDEDEEDEEEENDEGKDNNDGDEYYQNVDEGSDHKDHNLGPLLLETQRNLRISETWATRTRKQKVLRKHRKVGPDVRDDDEKEETRLRDRKRCVALATGGPIEVAHIYPFSLNAHTNTTKMLSFWSTLKNYWPEKQVDSWKRAVLGKKGTESPQNMITLSPTVHKLWSGCYFAFKPISLSRNRRKLVMEFHWLRPRPKATKGHHMVDALTPPDSVAEHDTPGEGIRLVHGPSKAIIISGRRVVMRTDDPKKRPLPSYQLLEMQWNLQRVGALSAAAEPRQDEHVDDDEDATARESVGSFLSDIDEGDDTNDEDDDDDDEDDDEDDNDNKNNDDDGYHSPYDGSSSPLQRPPPETRVGGSIPLGRPSSPRPARRSSRPSLSLSTRFSPHSPRSPTRLSHSPLRSPWELLAGPSLGSPSSPHHQPRPSPRLSPTRTSQENEPPSPTKSSERRRSRLGSHSSLSSFEKPRW